MTGSSASRCPGWSIAPGCKSLGWLDPGRLFNLIREHWEDAGGIATTVLGYVSRSGFALLGMVANIVLLPVLTFFFLRDWDLMVGVSRALVPRDHFGTVRQLAMRIRMRCSAASCAGNCW